MARTRAIETGTFQHNLVAALLRETYNDLQGQGYVGDDLPPAAGTHSKAERARIKRRELQQKAEAFVYSEDFRYWASFVGLDPDRLRELMLHGNDDQGTHGAVYGSEGHLRAAS